MKTKQQYYKNYAIIIWRRGQLAENEVCVHNKQKYNLELLYLKWSMVYDVDKE